MANTKHILIEESDFERIMARKGEGAAGNVITRLLDDSEKKMKERFKDKLLELEDFVKYNIAHTPELKMMSSILMKARIMLLRAVDNPEILTTLNIKLNDYLESPESKLDKDLDEAQTLVQSHVSGELEK